MWGCDVVSERERARYRLVLAIGLIEEEVASEVGLKTTIETEAASWTLVRNNALCL